MKRYGLETTEDNSALAAWADVVVLAVKPQNVNQALRELASGAKKGILLISIAAGVPIRQLEGLVPPTTRVVRAMPNTAAIALAAATAIAQGSRADESDLAIARQLFEAVGSCVVVPERALDAVTGLSGSGPAYVLLVIEALADGGVKAGLSREVALRLAAQTVYGTAKLQIESGEHPAVLRDRVTSPAGTTAEGLARLEARSVRAAFIEAVDAATRRARELGRE
jgi:pyrroline-5-carboxylate reductase